MAKTARAHVIQELPEGFDIVADAESPLVSAVLVAPYILLFVVLMGLIGYYYYTKIFRPLRQRG